MAYSQSDIDNWWFGQDENGPGSATNFKPGAYVTMKLNDVIALTNSASAVYSAGWAAVGAYLYQQALAGTGVGPTGANGFNDRSTIGGKWFQAISSGCSNGPTKS